MSAPFDLVLGLKGAYGALPASRMKLNCDRAITIPFQFEIRSSQFSHLKVAVFAHIFYPELSAEIRSYLGNIPLDFDLFVSTDAPEKKSEIEGEFQAFGPGRCTVQVFPNRGRDIAPFLVGFSDEILRYDIVCHLHSKRSKHNDILYGWREYAFRQLLGSPSIVNSIFHSLDSGAVDLLFPDHFGPVVQSLNYGYDFDLMRDLLGRLGVAFSKDILLEFPSGSMFWARSRALAPLLDLGLQLKDFPEETGQIDGTLAHAIERSLAFVTEVSGGRWAKIVQAQDCKQRNRLISVWRKEDVSLAVTRASRRLLGNRVSTNLQPRFTPELTAVGFRPEASSRPRFTLLIPTLKPTKVFGGIASALRLFEQILSHFRNDVDARIVSLTDNVDLDCMESAKGYTLVNLGAENTALRRTVVDASGVQSAQLPLRRHEIFLATAWWTAFSGFEMQSMQREAFGAAPPLFYFIQDHEPDFYGWSSRYVLAQSTYFRKSDAKMIVNSEELYNFMEKNYGFEDAYYVPYAVNERLRSHFRPRPKERIILIYGRPGTPRNGFEILLDGLCLWQQTYPTEARAWRIVSAGEEFEPWRAQHVSNFEILGKLSLSDYADILCRSAVGISLMVSPHPSYPPLEMAEAGAITVTNKYDEKDLSLRSDNIVSTDLLTPHSLAEQIALAVSRAEATIGESAQFRPIAAIPCKGKMFSAAAVAQSIEKFIS
ncbi:rhamnan synthesis F family protein [Methylocapsa polymorpha]|uniref:Rhamnan synthesis F family protein n=1 Tax=Methylocapsa polymorpha TaxID=3080828 RepID=A0ABZ0HT51_9HYPH|nr:rhamnan synthesis F family protein [Methylocapsa sp. RX1]